MRPHVAALAPRILQALTDTVHGLLDQHTTPSILHAADVLRATSHWLLAPPDHAAPAFRELGLLAPSVGACLPEADKAGISQEERWEQENMLELRRRLVGSPLLVRHTQALLLGPHAAAWARALGQRRWRHLLAQWLCPLTLISRPNADIGLVLFPGPGSGPGPGSSFLPSDRAENAADITLWGLRVLCQVSDNLCSGTKEHASLESEPQVPRPPQTQTQLPPAKADPVVVQAALYVGTLFARLSLAHLYLHLGLITTTSSEHKDKRNTMHRVELPDIVQLLCSLPTRLSNVSQGQIPLSLSHGSFNASLTRRWEELLYLASMLWPNWTRAYRSTVGKSIATFLLQFERNGWLRTPPTADGPPYAGGVWGALLPRLCRRATAPPEKSQYYVAVWRAVLVSLRSGGIGDRVSMSLLLWVEARSQLPPGDNPNGLNAGKSSQPSPPATLVTRDEMSRTGAEGSAFLSHEKMEEDALLSWIIRLVSGPSPVPAVPRGRKSRLHKSQLHQTASSASTLTPTSDATSTPEPSFVPHFDPAFESESDSDSDSETMASSDSDTAFIDPFNSQTPDAFWKAILSPLGAGTWQSANLIRALQFLGQLPTHRSVVPAQSAQSVEPILSYALAQWADPSLLLTTSRGQTIARAVLLASCIGRLRRLVSINLGDRALVHNILNKARSSEHFHAGVTAYLDHPWPDARRVGLVCAEILVGAVADLDPRANDAPSGGSGTPGTPGVAVPARLDFGPEVWAGSGGGKEEARVLRSLVCAWPSDEQVRRMLASFGHGTSSTFPPVSSTGTVLGSENAKRNSVEVRYLFGIPEVPTSPPDHNDAHSDPGITSESEAGHQLDGVALSTSNDLSEGRSKFSSRLLAPDRRRKSALLGSTESDQHREQQGGGVLGPGMELLSLSEHRSSPSPARRRSPPPGLRLGTLASSSRRPKSKPLIQPLDSSGDEATTVAEEDKRKRIATRDLRPHTQPLGFAQLDPSSESSGEDSSDDGEEALTNEGLPTSSVLNSTGDEGATSAGKINLDPDAKSSPGFNFSQAAQKRDTMSYRMPKARARAPVYVHELPGFLHSGNRSQIRTALHTLPALVRSKADWGAEVTDNAVELVHALVGLQDSFGIQDFDMHISRCLTALAVAAPDTAAPTIVELIFSTHLSLSAKHGLLAAVVAAGLELAGESPPIPADDTLGNSTNAKVVAAYFSTLMDEAIRNAKDQGTAHVPALQRKEALKLSSSAPETKLRKHDRQIHNAALHAGIVPQATPDYTGAVAAATAKWRRGGVPNFVAPLIARTLAHLGVARTYTPGSLVSRSGHNASWPLAAMSPLLLPSLLESAGVLMHVSRMLSPWEAHLAPATLELSLAASRTAQACLSGTRTLPIRLASLELALVVVVNVPDRWAREHMALLIAVGQDAAEIFANPESGGASATAVAAAVQLRLAELCGAWTESGSLLGSERELL